MDDVSWTFWIIAAGLVVLAVLPMMTAFLRGRQAAATAAEYDLQVYRDQLRELERDVAKGTVPEAEAARIRTEVSRRILDADRARSRQRSGVVAAGPVLLGGVAVVAVVGVSAALYLALGAPGRGDLPRAERIATIERTRAARPSQAAFEAEAGAMPSVPLPEAEGDAGRLQMLTELREVMERRPDDIAGWELLAIEEARQGNFRAARRAQDRVLSLREVPGAADLVLLAEFMIRSANGYVSPEAEEALRRGLAQAPDHPWGRYYLGLMYAQQNRPDRAYPIWRRLLADSQPGAPWIQPILLQIEQVAFLAGTPISIEDLPVPQAPAGPSAAEIEAAGDLPAETRAQMIGNMVARLADRVATEGGAPADWARLVGAYTVLGQDDNARAVLSEAREVFADAPEALAMIEAAAEGRMPASPMGRPEASDPARPRRRRVICDDIVDFAAAAGPAGALLGLDLGTRTIGVAASDRTRSVATPLGTIRRRKFGLDAARIEAFLPERAVAGLVLGLPRNMDGSEGPRAQSTRAFARNLARLPAFADLPIGFWDERLSTIAAERALLEADASRARRADVIDHVAAGFILQGVLDRLRHLRGT